MLRSFGYLNTRALCRNIEPLSSTVVNRHTPSSPLQWNNPIRSQYRYNSEFSNNTQVQNTETETGSEGSLDFDFRSELLTEGEEVVVTSGSNLDLSSTFYSYARFLTEIHDTHQIPWYLLIIGASVAIKAVMSPLLISSAKVSAKIGQEELCVQSIQKAYQKSKGGNMSYKDSGELRAKISQYYKSKGISPGKSLLSMFILLPIQFYSFFQIRAICVSDYPGLETEGFLWFTNLTAPDPTFMLPVLSTLFSVSNMFIGPLVLKRMNLKPKPFQALMTKIMSGFLVIIGAVISTLPAGLQLLIFMNIFTTFVLTLSYRLPLVRTIFRLPPNTGLPLSMAHSKREHVTKAFGAEFGKLTPPDPNYQPKKSLIARMLSYLKQ